MQSTAPKICVISASPFSMFFFFSEHLRKMSEWSSVTIVYNKSYHPEAQPINAPVNEEHVKIKRNISLIDDVLALISLIRLFKRNQFDMVITLAPKAGLLGMMAARLCRVQVRLNIFQGEVWATRKGLYRFLLRFADTLTATLSTDILAVSNSQRRFLIKEGVVSADKALVLGHGSIGGVNSERFKRDSNCRREIRDQYNIEEAANVLIFVGRITRDKGVFDLVASFVELLIYKPNTHLFIVGPDDDGLSSDLAAIMSSKDRHKLIFAGITEEPERFMAAADILCLPSHREGFGMVALEAAACEIPTIGSDIYGIRDAIVHKQTGLLVPSGNRQALVGALNLLLEDHNLRTSLGKNGRSRVLLHFNSNHVIDNYVSHFKKRSTPLVELRSHSR